MSDISTVTGKTKWYEESAGVVSSKRVIGAILVAVGVIMLGVLFAACLVVKSELSNGDLAGKLAISVIAAGAGLLGLSVGTDFAKAIESKTSGGGL